MLVKPIWFSLSANYSLSDSNASDPPIVISACKVRRVLCSLKTGKASGPDGILPRFLMNWCLFFIIFFTLFLFRFCLWSVTCRLPFPSCQGKLLNVMKKITLPWTTYLPYSTGNLPSAHS